MNFIDTLYRKLNQIADNPSTNAKLDVVRTFTPDELRVVAKALDPAVNFYIATIDAPASIGQESWDAQVDDLLDLLSTRQLTGNAARKALTDQLSRLNPQHAEMLLRVVLKDLKCGVGSTMVNRAFPGTIFEPPYMRCSLPAKSNMPKWGDDVWNDGVISQEKADGMFASLTTNGRVTLMSRQGKTFPADLLPDLHTTRANLEGYQLHGELLVSYQGRLLERQIGNGLLNALQQGEPLSDGHFVHYVVWDMIPVEAAVSGGKCDVPYIKRLTQLAAALQGEVTHAMPIDGGIAGLKSITKIETRIVRSYREAMAHYRELLQKGREGTIVKHPAGIWKDTTSKDCVKLKLEVDVELVVTGTTPGNGKNADLFGSLTCSSACGKLLVNVSGMPDDVRKALHARGDSLPGAVITVRANGIMKPSESNEKHSLFLPRFIEERFDTTADTLEEIEAQFEAAVATA